MRVPFQTQLWIEYLFLAFSPFYLEPPQIQLRTSRASPAAAKAGGGCGEEVEENEVEKVKEEVEDKQEVGKWRRRI